jgi:MYXO-CTERM domain-containing protein
MRIALIAVLSFIGALALTADPLISTSVTCQAYGQQAITSSASCEQGMQTNQPPYPPLASASSSASVVLQQNASDWLTISMVNNVRTIDGAVYLNVPPNQTSAPSFAGATSSIHIEFFTEGLPRPGYLEWQWTPIWQGNPGDWYPSVDYTIAQYGGACHASNATNCVGPGIHAPLMPFELGTSFNFDSTSSLYADSVDGNSSGYDGMLLQFRFLEADNQTLALAIDPDPVADAPEPSTAALGLLSLAAVLVIRQRRA